jgi:hypothetical protein
MSETAQVIDAKIAMNSLSATIHMQHVFQSRGVSELHETRVSRYYKKHGTLDSYPFEILRS